MTEKRVEESDKVILCEQEKALILLIRRIKGGKLRILVERGKPVRVELTRKNIEL